jgi:acyl-coenzyme A synthetase/AMP-(fatty) acid ligase
MIRPALPTAGVTLRRLGHAHLSDERQAYPLLAYRSQDDCVAWRGGHTFSVEDFLAAVGGLATRLPPQRHAVNLCRDRYCFLIGFAAALLSRHISLLPTCRTTEALAQLHDRYPESYILTDHENASSGMPVCYVPDGHSLASPIQEIPLIPSDRVAAVVFTSGSSGAPMAHAKTWGSLVKGAEALAHQFQMQSAIPRVVMGTVPAQHMYGLETTIMLPLQLGWSLHAGYPVLPADIQRGIHEVRVPAWLMTTPIHLRAYAGGETALRGIEGIISATMPLTRSLAARIERLWGVPVHEIYGCTEGGMIGSRRPTAGETWTLCRGLRLSRDGDAVWVSGGHVGESLQLADRITAHNEDEFLLHGPNHDLVKVAGKRASLAALNAILMRTDGVVDGTFYWPGFGKGGNGRLTAFVVAPGLRPSMILAALRTRLDPAFLPRPLHLVDALPRNSTGKLPREELKAFAARFTKPRPRRG